jgi:hypothetical protein
MVDISNKSLALVLAVAMIVSLGGTLVSLDRLGDTSITGLAIVDTGTANITIQSDLSIQVVDTNTDFGVGFTIDQGPGMEYCDINTNGTFNTTGDCVGFNPSPAPLRVENIGNQDVVNLTISFDSDAAAFLGGTSPVLAYWVNETESGACTGGTETATWTTVTNGDNVTICGDGGSNGFNFEAANDELFIHLNVSIPQDADTDSETMTITLQAVS